jgi:isopentenyl diphosphate isomerase/L-lactate dehydrogenase-like FMN-dependent dehydrogenase
LIQRPHGSRARNFTRTQYSALEFLDMIDITFAWPVDVGIRRLTSAPLSMKGILTAEGRAIAIEVGVDRVAVSNHGLGAPLGWGEGGVRPVLSILRAEFTRTAGLCGVRTFGDVSPRLAWTDIRR